MQNFSLRIAQLNKYEWRDDSGSILIFGEKGGCNEIGFYCCDLRFALLPDGEEEWAMLMEDDAFRRGGSRSHNAAAAAAVVVLAAIVMVVSVLFATGTKLS